MLKLGYVTTRLTSFVGTMAFDGDLIQCEGMHLIFEILFPPNLPLLALGAAGMYCAVVLSRLGQFAMPGIDAFASDERRRFEHACAVESAVFRNVRA